jgi:hypothetical protein
VYEPPGCDALWEQVDAGSLAADEFLMFLDRPATPTMLPLVAGGHYDFEVDWGDGSVEQVASLSDGTHRYQDTERGYWVRLRGTIEGWSYLLNLGLREGCEPCVPEQEHTAILQWGSVVWGDTERQYQSRSVSLCAKDAPGLKKTPRLNASFADTRIGNVDLNAWDVSSVTAMTYTFGSSDFNGDITFWDVSNVRAMSGLFADSIFNGEISDWDVANVTEMGGMFEASAFNGDISSWDVSGATGMSSMFATSVFDGDISDWDVSGVTAMISMFARSSFTGDLSRWDTSQLRNADSMFWQAAFDGDVSAWDISSATEMRDMFLESALSTPNYDALLIGWARQTPQPDVLFDASASYSAGAAATARSKLINNDGWRITDGGQAP